ncbi:MAG: histidine kinase [Gammaproteobacteria bacterium]|nr:histidine kinase [Gammaproteobacteria bacterium]NIR85677.1 histidine kinase [Gammaproteobacteria bacterium]NIR90210.1 histidine kinase [Gammaproteobacteria bacterium]NIU06811.1 histidine kinase [Gammaproteobacteria bacterium]NIV53744.1 histidine kinase [Gammaproteobacteria bacterium]
MAREAFSIGHSEAPSWREAVERCLDELHPLPAAANLGFVYLTDALAGHARDALEAFRERAPGVRWVGTVGMGICGPGVEYYTQPAIAALVGAFPDDSFRVFSAMVSGLRGFDAGHRAWCARSRPYFGVVHGDPRHHAIAELVAGLSERMEDGFLVGGLASSRGRYPQIADDVVDGGLSGVLFNAEVPVTTRLTQGCSPIGPRHEITRADEQILIELDRRPALDVFKEDIGEVLARDLSRVGGYIFAGLPVAGSDTGDYLVRNLVALDPRNNMLAVADTVSTGQSVMFCRRDAQSAQQDLLRMLGEIKRSLSGPPRAGIYHSCIARGTNLFGPDSRELKLIEQELGTFPLVGFFGNGEISHNRLYGYTGVLTLFL